MGTFKTFIENTEQEGLVGRVLTKLFYGAGLDHAAIAQMPIKDLMNYITQVGFMSQDITPIRFAAMVKMAANMHNNNMQITPTTEDQ